MVVRLYIWSGQVLPISIGRHADQLCTVGFIQCWHRAICLAARSSSWMRCPWFTPLLTFVGGHVIGPPTPIGKSTTSNTTLHGKGIDQTGARVFFKKRKGPPTCTRNQQNSLTTVPQDRPNVYAAHTLDPLWCRRRTHSLSTTQQWPSHWLSEALAMRILSQPRRCCIGGGPTDVGTTQAGVA